MKKKKRFLGKIAEKLFLEYGDNLSNIVIVFPSRRAHIFFIDELSHFIKRPIWLPKFYSIEDIVFQIGGLTPITKLELFFNFYSLYKKTIKTPQSLDQCFKWAPVLLEDFNEIDKSCADYESLFSVLSDIKRLESWDLNIDETSEHINDYLLFFDELKILYQKLKSKLLNSKVVYSGLAQRHLSESSEMVEEWMRYSSCEKIIFIGLDALTNAQEKIINSLLKKDLCDIYWDTDQYFIGDIQQESGKFLRRYKKKWPTKFTQITNEFLDSPKEIKILGTSKTITQAKLLGNLLMNKNYTADSIKRVAIILPNEHLLLPVLESLPPEIQNINVTMGYNLYNHPIVSLYDDILSLYLNKKNNMSNLKYHFQTRDIINLLDNSYCKLIIDNVIENTGADLSIIIKRTGLKYIDNKQLSSLIDSRDNHVLNLLFKQSITNSTYIIELFKSFTNELLSLIERKNNSSNIEVECLFEIDQNLKLISDYFNNLSEEIDLKTFSIFFKQLLQGKKLNFVGEPLKGIQIMGLLESRTIDFDEVFVLSANEGHLPPVSRKNSFIPVDIKSNFGMRTYLDRDALYANHFFNLIKRPNEISILYNNDLSSSSFKSGEKSRFLQQLIYEVKTLKNHHISIHEALFSDVFKVEKMDSGLIIKKDLFILNKIQELCRTGFSASTINLYNYCNRQFYFEKILGIKQELIKSENLDNMNMGLVIHHVLKKIYQPHLNQELTINMLDSMKSNLKNCINRSLVKYNIQEVSKGKNLLAIKAIERIVSNFLFQERKEIAEGNKIVIKFLDDPQAIPPQNLAIQASSLCVNIKGIIDRIDIYNNQYRIIDYKTGSVHPSEIQSIDLSDLDKKPKLLQLLLYALLFNKHNKSINMPIVSGIINLRAKKFKIQYCQVNKIKMLDSEILRLFEDKLGKIILGICDERVSFEHINRDAPCRFCD